MALGVDPAFTFCLGCAKNFISLISIRFVRMSVALSGSEELISLILVSVLGSLSSSSEF